MALPPPYWIGAYFNYGPDESSQVFDLARNIRSAIGRHRQIAIGPKGMLPGRRVWKLANGVQIETTLIAKGVTEDWAVRVFVPPSTATTPCYAYMESGLAVFEFPYTGAAEIRFTTAISAFIAARGDAFSLVGRLAVLASDVYTYPPLADLTGKNFSQGDSANITQESYLTSIVIASEWSGRNMKQWIQAKLGSGVSSQRGSWLASATIGGAFVQNTAVQSHWIYEHRDDSRLEYWAIEANSEGPVRVGLMRLTCASQALALYLQAYSGMSTTDAAWIRGWILQGASWPTEWETIYGELPAVGGLGYGWHVSDSGALASIHSLSLYDILSGAILHHRSKWYRHDMIFSMSYDSDGAAQWDCDISTTETGTLETGHYNGLCVWGVSGDGTPAIFITDPSITAPQPLASNAEVWGEYYGETWGGVTVSDTPLGYTHCETNGDYPTCESSSWLYYGSTPGPGSGACAYTRVMSVDGETAEIGQDIAANNYAWLDNGTYEWPEWQYTSPQASDCLDWSYGDCSGDWVFSAGSARWYASGVGVRQDYIRSSSPTINGGIALVLAVGLADGHIVTKASAVSATIYQKESYFGSAIGPSYHQTDIYMERVCNDPVEGTSTWEYYGEAIWAGGTYFPGNYLWDVTESSEAATAQRITAQLITPGGNLTLYSSSGGSGGDYPTEIGAKYSASGTIDYGGWEPYLDTSVYDPDPQPVYAVASAVAGVLTGCTGPGCGARVATDDSAGITTSNIAMWVGNA